MTHGPEAVDELIQSSSLSYPVSLARLERAHPLANITIDEKGNSILLAELLTDVDIDTFGDENDVSEVLGPVFERERSDRRSGIVGRIKNAF